MTDFVDEVEAMQFTGISFLFYFLPIFLAVYYLVPGLTAKNGVLLGGSLLYYALAVEWAVVPILVLLAATALTYWAGIAISDKRKYWWIFPLVLAGMAAVWGFFKTYADGAYFPAGMSFYLFQMAAYLISVYQQKQPAERSPLRYGTQMLMFPKITSGPIYDPVLLQNQVSRRPSVSLKTVHKGLQILILGLGLKVLIANRIASLWNQVAVIGYESVSTPFAWLSLLGYAMKLYFDFWGYSLMALGLGRMLGLYLPKNFDDPYTARSVSEFYRRWHVSLGMWFRNNLYIPLGGNRKGNLRTVLNLLAVWLFTGLWHGVGGNYLLWAGILVFFIILERLILRRFLEKRPIFSHIYTVFVILISWVPFAIGDWTQMCTFMGRLFGIGNAGTNGDEFWHWLKQYAVLLIPGVALMTAWPGKLWKKIEDRWWADGICLVLFWVSVYFIATAAQDPFMYF